jgi:hypothetical protein
MKILHKASHKLGNRREALLPGHVFSKTFFRKMNTIIHQKEIYHRIECRHIRCQLKGTSRTFDRIIGMAENKYKFFFFPTLLFLPVQCYQGVLLVDADNNITSC